MKRKNKFFYALTALLAAVLLFTACDNDGGGGGGTTTSWKPPVNIISVHPTSADYVGAAPTIADLKVAVPAGDEDTVTYQWYQANTFKNSGGSAISGATTDTLSPDLGDKTESFFYAVVNWTKAGGANQTQASNPARIRVLESDEDAPTAIVTITSTNGQYVRGFGGMSNAFGIGSPARYMEVKDIDTMFNPETGLGYNILRIMIWPDPLDEVISGQVEPQMRNQTTYLQVVKKVNAYGGYVLASPWSPPPDWKVNEKINGSAPSYLLARYYGAYANYLADYARYMNIYEAPIYAISIQNEPSWPASYAGCEWTSQQQVDFFNTTGVGKFTTGVPGYGGGESITSVKLMSGEAHQDVTWNNAARDNPTANAAIDIYAYHTYGNKNNLYTAVQADTPNMRKEVWMTEININSGEGNYAQDSTWNFVWRFADELDNDVRSDSANAFVWWYAKRFYSFIGDGSYGTVNGEVQPRGWVMSHWAKYATDTVRVITNVSGHPEGNQSGDGKGGTVRASAYRRKATPVSYWEQQVKNREDSISLVIYDKRTGAGTEVKAVRARLPADFGTATSVSAIISDSTGKRHAPHLVVLTENGAAADFNLPANSIISLKFTK